MNKVWQQRKRDMGVDHGKELKSLIYLHRGQKQLEIKVT